MAQFTMDGDEVLGLNKVDQQLHFFLTCMTRDMDRLNGFIDHIRTTPEEAVDGAEDAFLVTRNGMG